MEYITSRINESIKDAIRLKNRNIRNEKSRFFFEGIHLLEEYTRFGLVPEKVFATGSALERYGKTLDTVGQAVTAVSNEVYQKLTEEKAPQGVFCISGFLNNITGSTDIPQCGGVILDGIQDPGNVGTIIRTAAALGIQKVIMSADCADIYSSKTIRASMGAVFCTDITVTDNLPLYINKLTDGGKHVYASMLDKDAKPFSGIALCKNDFVVIGNEGNGIREESAAACTERVFIEMSARTESLNAAAAAVIFMWEMSKNNG